MTTRPTIIRLQIDVLAHAVLRAIDWTFCFIWLISNFCISICNCSVSNILRTKWELSGLVGSDQHQQDETVLSCWCRRSELGAVHALQVVKVFFFITFTRLKLATDVSSYKRTIMTVLLHRKVHRVHSNGRWRRAICWENCLMAVMRASADCNEVLK